MNYEIFENALVVAQTAAQLHHRACYFSFSSPKCIVVYYAETDPGELGELVVRLEDYNDAGWYFRAECWACGHNARIWPIDVLKLCPAAHLGMCLVDNE